MLQAYNQLFIHSGNILDIPEIKSKTGIKSSEELMDCINIALQHGKRIGDEKMLEIYNLTPDQEIVHARELMTNVKIFLKTPTKEALTDALDTLRSVLYNLSIDSIIIWYPKEMKDEPTDELLDLWTVLDEYSGAGKIHDLGIADVETEVFISLFNKVKVKPSIFHLSVQHCCLVPPDLQAFADKEEIQLLTHYDPPDILPEGTLVKEIDGFKPYWIARYHSHVKCRGVLAKKGYLAKFHQL